MITNLLLFVIAAALLWGAAELHMLRRNRDTLFPRRQARRRLL